MIIRLDIPPGSPIDEDRISRDLSLGLTPIRDALKRLSFERLVMIYPRRGTFAAEINIGDDLWLTEVRVELEGLAAALAAERATDRQRIALVDIASEIRVTRGPLDFTRLDASFHGLIYAAAHNPLLEAALDRYFGMALRIWYFGIQNFSRDNIVEDDFITIASHIAEARGDKAREAMRQHIRHSRFVIEKHNAF